MSTPSTLVPLRQELDLSLIFAVVPIYHCLGELSDVGHAGEGEPDLLYAVLLNHEQHRQHNYCKVFVPWPPTFAPGNRSSGLATLHSSVIMWIIGSQNSRINRYASLRIHQ